MTALLFIFISSIKPPVVLGIEEGDTCQIDNAASDCLCYPTGYANLNPCCCKCDGKYWIHTKFSPCSIPGAGEQIVNPVLKKFGVGEGADIIAQLIANALKIAFSVSGLILLVMLIGGGIGWMLGGGNKEAIGKAQSRITNALVGFVVLMSIFAIINYLLPALGIDLNILQITWPTL